MTTEEFIETLSAQQVVDAELARQLRTKAVEGGARVTPQAILKFLVKTDVITSWKGEELSAMIESGAPPTPARKDEIILELAPIEEDPTESDAQRSRKPPIEPTAPPPPPRSSQSPPPVLEPLT